MLIISVLQNFQAKTQAVFRHHNFWVVALNNNTIKMFIFSGICKYFGDSAKNRPPFYRSSQAVLGRRRSKFLIRSFGKLAGFRARFLCNKCANNYMLSNVVGALYALFTSVLMYYLVQDPLGTKLGASKIANKNKQICLIYFDYISLQRCKIRATYLYLAWVK